MYVYIYVCVYMCVCVYIYICVCVYLYRAFLLAQSVKNPPERQETACNAGDLGSIPGSGRYPGEGNGNPLHCSCLGNPMNKGAW